MIYIMFYDEKKKYKFDSKLNNIHNSYYYEEHFYFHFSSNNCNGCNYCILFKTGQN